MQQLELRIPPLLLVLIFALAMLAVARYLPAVQLELPFAATLAVIFMAVGVLIALLGVMAFRQAQTTVDPRYPAKSATLVVNGIYRYSRNPMYLGFFFMLLAVACYLANTLAFVLLPLFVLYMNQFQILPEERWLQQKFSAQYTAYQAKVRRWL